MNYSAIHWAALQENTTTGYCYTAQPCQKAQHRQELMRAAGHSFSPGTQRSYCDSNSGGELADLFLHVGSGWLSTVNTDTTEAVMNDLSLFL